MIIEVIQWPESQAVMSEPDWFFIMGNSDCPLGNSAYGRILDSSEFTLTEPEVIYGVNNLQDEDKQEGVIK